MMFGVTITHAVGRSSIMTAGGRLFWGHPPGCRLGPVSERAKRDELATMLRGLVEVRVAVGRADLMTSTHVFEVERLKTWSTGLQQAVAYAAVSEQRPALALVEANDPDRLMKAYLRIRDKLPHVALWAHGERTGWQPITSVAEAGRRRR
jgi:hypothetical protein